MTGTATTMLDAQVVVRREAYTLDVAVRADAGDVVAVLGPNGAGKSTLLAALAGLVAIDEGHVVVDGATLDDPVAGVLVPPERRGVSLVPQDLVLFTHLDARANVAFGLRARGIDRRRADAAAQGWLDRLGVGDLATRRPAQLSGGQAQRVALARALAPSPSLLLLDEPLSALDVQTRASVRRDVRAHLDAFAGVALVVTHDPLDALALASQVVVLEDGRVVQAGPIDELTTRPRSRYVADLLGVNLLHGVADGHTVRLDATGVAVAVADAGAGEVAVLVHPHAVALHRAEPEGSPRNRWRARVAGVELLGDRVRVRLDGAVPLTAEVTTDAVRALDLHEGAEVWATVKATEIRTYPR